ncbi:MAG TPA: trypsin-like peptidase domain-containing protein [Gemmataceae bacterium]|nr:trypsin-like peptidase domain-containing protein [Gemmataceae bacterium]
MKSKFLTGLLVALLASVASAQSPADVRVHAPTAPGVSDTGCGVCVESKAGRSVVVTCQHVVGCVGRQVVVVHRGKTYPATVAAACGQTDVAVLVVQGVLPVATLAPVDAPVGVRVTHNGATTGPAEGVVLPYRRSYVEPKAWFVAAMPSISGDSGAAVYAGREVVALLCGRAGVNEADPLRGCPVSEIRPVVARVATDFADAPTKQPEPPAQATTATVRVEQVVVGADGRVFTRIVEKPAGYVVMAPVPAQVVRPQPMFFAPPVQFRSGCANGRCFR